jgi:hypothetical protein
VFFPVHAVVLEVFPFMFLEPCYQLQGTSLGLTMIPHAAVRPAAQFDTKIQETFKFDTRQCMRTGKCRQTARDKDVTVRTAHIAEIIMQYYPIAAAAAANRTNFIL